MIVLWMQNVDHPARWDRQHTRYLTGDVSRVLDGFIVTATTPTPSLDLDVTAGGAVVVGGDESDQGSYLCVLEADAVLTMPAAPGSDQRIDTIYVKVQDPQAGGDAGDTAVLLVEQGSPGTSPAPPDFSSIPSALPLYDVLRTAGESDVTDGQITDRAPRSGMPLFGRIETTNPQGQGGANSLWIKTGS